MLRTHNVQIVLLVNDPRQAKVDLLAYAMAQSDHELPCSHLSPAMFRGLLSGLGSSWDAQAGLEIGWPNKISLPLSTVCLFLECLLTAESLAGKEERTG